MMYPIETMKQPDGSTIYIELEQIDGYGDEDIERLGIRHRYDAIIHKRWPFGSYHCPRTFQKKLYGDTKGLYTYKTQKEPFYTWKVNNIEEEYEHWTKDRKGYHIPLNEPRIIKKDVF